MSWLSDLWRGYSDSDVRSLQEKLKQEAANEPGAIIKVNAREMRAWLDGAHNYQLQNGPSQALQ